jgi:hypothetical protein
VALVSHLSPSDIGTTVQILPRHFFSEDELKTSSRTGKKNPIKFGESVRPALNQQKMQTLERLVITKTGIGREM